MSNDIAGIILQKIREKKGRLSIISDESSINRKHFNVEDFTKMTLMNPYQFLPCNVTESLPNHRTGAKRLPP